MATQVTAQLSLPAILTWAERFFRMLSVCSHNLRINAWSSISLESLPSQTWWKGWYNSRDEDNVYICVELNFALLASLSTFMLMLEMIIKKISQELDQSVIGGLQIPLILNCLHCLHHWEFSTIRVGVAGSPKAPLSLLLSCPCSFSLTFRDISGQPKNTWS